MTDSHSSRGASAFGPEPTRDRQLGARLRHLVGDTPHGAVNWPSLAERIAGRVALQMPAPWWSYATRWERHVIAASLAAGIAATFALWTSSASSTSSSATLRASVSLLSTAVLTGTPPEDAASQFARSITNAVDLTAGIPE